MLSALCLSLALLLAGHSTAEATDINGTITADGSAVQVNITSPGQKAYYTFDGTAGQLLGVGISQVSGLSGAVYVLKPDGNKLAFGNIYASGNDIDPVALPSTGTYTLKVDPSVTTGSLTLTLSADLTGTIDIDGSPVITSIGRAGQNTRITFNGTASQLLGVGITQVTGLSGVVRVLKPDGSQLTSGGIYAAGNGIDLGALPSTGTYTLKVDPGVATGSLTLTLSADLTGTIDIDGSPVTTSIGRAGQNTRITFNGTASQLLGVGITQVTGLSGVVRVLKPDGSQLTSGGIYAAGNDVDPVALPSTGTYTLKVDPGVATGSLTLTLSSAIAGWIYVDGPTVGGTIARAGQNAYYGFSGTAGQLLGIGIMPGGLSGYVRVLNPDGTTLTTGSIYSSSGNDIDPVALPATGTYTLKVDPGVATGSLTLTLSNDITGAISIDWSAVDATIDRVGQNARLTFYGTEAQEIGVAITPGGLSGYLRVLKPDGTTLTSGAIYSSSSNDVGPVTLPSPGMYALKVDPGVNTGSVTLSISSAQPPTYWESNGGEYSYGGGCAPGTEIDPITTLLLSNAPTDEAALQQTEDALSDAGLDDGANVVTTRQDFRDHGGCPEGEITQASEDSLCFLVPCAEERWHARCNVVSVPSPVGYWAACTPHWDETGCGTFDTHYVPAVFAGHGPGGWQGSGFDAARDWLWWALVQEDGMSFVGYVDFDNVQPMHQCNGDWTQADGRVNIIQLQ